MISPRKLLKVFVKSGIDTFYGVPDSVLKNFTNLLNKNKKIHHKIFVNEGTACACAVGSYLATKKLPVVYLQNSGLGNMANPYLSIAHKKVYSIPMILLIGWRGFPNSDDEPQHLVTGKITKQLLKLMQIKVYTLSKDIDLEKIKSQIKKAKTLNHTIAYLIRNKTIK